VSSNKLFVKSKVFNKNSTLKPLEIQIEQHHFNFKTVYKKQRTAGGMPHPQPTDLDMTKHSDYFVWKDTLERVAQRCDDTVDMKRVNSCVPKYRQKNPEMLSPTRY